MQRLKYTGWAFNSLFILGVWQEIQPDLALHRGKELWQLRDSRDQTFHLLLLGPGGHPALQIWLRRARTHTYNYNILLTRQRHPFWGEDREAAFFVLSIFVLRIKMWPSKNKWNIYFCLLHYMSFLMNILCSAFSACSFVCTYKLLISSWFRL